MDWSKMFRSLWYFKYLKNFPRIYKVFTFVRFFEFCFRNLKVFRYFAGFFRTLQESWDFRWIEWFLGIFTISCSWGKSFCTLWRFQRFLGFSLESLGFWDHCETFKILRNFWNFERFLLRMGTWIWRDLNPERASSNN